MLLISIYIFLPVYAKFSFMGGVCYTYGNPFAVTLCGLNRISAPAYRLWLAGSSYPLRNSFAYISSSVAIPVLFQDDSVLVTSADFSPLQVNVIFIWLCCYTLPFQYQLLQLVYLLLTASTYIQFIFIYTHLLSSVVISIDNRMYFIWEIHF